MAVQRLHRMAGIAGCLAFWLVAQAPAQVPGTSQPGSSPYLAASAIPTTAPNGYGMQPVSGAVPQGMYDYYKHPVKGDVLTSPLPAFHEGVPPGAELPPKKKLFEFNRTFNPSRTNRLRLDTSYKLLRELNLMTTGGEDQVMVGMGGTLLPLQTPCFITGLRAMATAGDRASFGGADGKASIDLWGGTRFHKLYLKGGVFWDDIDEYEKFGGTLGVMSNLPLLGVTTLDMAYGGDTLGEVTDDPRFFRESASDDFQLRLGKFINPNWQLGASYQYFEYNYGQDEFQAGVFTNIYCGRFRFGGDVSGGDGARGYVTVGFAWGKPACDHPYDPDMEGVDAVAWITQAVERDILVRVRETDR